MRKIPVIFSTILLSNLAYAGDAPTDIVSSGISLNIGGHVMAEGIAINGKCLNEASPADVFSNELNTTNQTSINNDLETLGFAAGSSIGNVAQMGMAQNFCRNDNIEACLLYTSDAADE